MKKILCSLAVVLALACSSSVMAQDVNKKQEPAKCCTTKKADNTKCCDSKKDAKCCDSKKEAKCCDSKKAADCNKK